MRISLRSELPHFAIILAMFGFAAATWAAAPERIPVHWNAYGVVDGYGGKFEGLLLLPLTAAGIYLLMIAIPKIDPGKANYEQFATAYSTLRIAVTLQLAGIYFLTQMSIHGYSVNMTFAVPVLVGLLFIVIGNLLGKVRPNWLLGLRTPWTLSSKTAWDKTHRVGGRLFIVAGFLLMLSGTVAAPWNLYLDLSIALILLVSIFGYSYWTWRNASDKVPPTGTLPAR